MMFQLYNSRNNMYEANILYRELIIKFINILYFELIIKFT